ncbi:putative cell division control protein 45 [Blattamonas nauphoetae]|uniref:Cell division control protein 45 n=1 Tax=Blattamonas nauphoetae TaxID=2049346 RepID=A0ABQ9WZS7_9EUKA|nr:putative cell division control protein 45 [Blattamonas nauphoetae]
MATLLTPESPYGVVILLNCGNTINLEKRMNHLIQDRLLVIIDSNRPFRLENAFAESQSLLIVDDGSGQEALETLTQNETVTEEAKQKYYEFSFHGIPSAHILHTLANELDMDRNDTLWAGIVGLTYSMLRQRIDETEYSTLFKDLRPEIQRLNTFNSIELLTPVTLSHSSHDIDGIIPIFDYPLTLYRHWSLSESIQHTHKVAANLHTWADYNQTAAKSLIAAIGVPLLEADKDFRDMPERNKISVDTFFFAQDDGESSFKSKLPPQEIRQLSRSKTEEQIRVEVRRKYKLYPVETAVRKKKAAKHYSASDYVYSLMGLLDGTWEDNRKSKASSSGDQNSQEEHLNLEWRKSFFRALDALSENGDKLVEEGIKQYKLIQQTVIETGKSILRSKKLITSSLRHVTLNPSIGITHFNHLQTLNGIVSLSHFLLDIFEENTPTKRGEHSPIFDPKPLIVAVPHPHISEKLLVVASCPRSYAVGGRTPFTQSFRRAAQKARCEKSTVGFEGTAIILNRERTHLFIDALEFPQYSDIAVKARQEIRHGFRLRFETDDSSDDDADEEEEGEELGSEDTNEEEDGAEDDDTLLLDDEYKTQFQRGGALDEGMREFERQAKYLGKQPFKADSSEDDPKGRLRTEEPLEDSDFDDEDEGIEEVEADGFIVDENEEDEEDDSEDNDLADQVEVVEGEEEEEDSEHEQ